MTDRHFSMFRGKAGSGLGEGPGSHVGLGEQYLAADPEVFTEAICTGARPWLTLDAPEQALAGRLESWSCFASDGFLFVARMLPVRVAFDPRPTYFAHARAFPLSDALAPVDPGVYLGVSAAFDAPWLPDARPPLTPLPPLEAPRPAAADRDVAASLLGHMYQAFVRGYPVVITAAPADCVVGGRLFSLVAYARAALPWSIKREYRARLFTREARLFLRHLGAHLLVVPDSAAAEALETRRDALLLDTKANVLRGEPLAAEARAYAETLRTTVEKLPHALLPFAARAAEHLPARSLPTPHDLLIAQAVYNLAAASPGKMDSLFMFLLTRLSAEATSELPFDRILRPQEVQAVSDARLTEGLLYGVGGEAVSPSTEALLRVAAAEARARRMTVDERVRALTGPPTEAHLRKMGWLAREKLLSAGTMAEKTVALPLGRVAELLLPAEALGHERDAGVLVRRESSIDDLATWAGRDSAVRDLLLDATADGILSDRWLVACGERAQGEGLVTLTAALLEREQAAPRLAASLDGLLSRLGGTDRALLRGLRLSLEAAVKRTDPVAATARYLERSILLHVSGGLPVAVQQIWQQALGKIRDPGTRQEILRRAAEVTGIWVDDEGALVVPLTWDRDIARLVLDQESLRRRLSFQSMARLARHMAPSEPGFDAFVSAADREASSDLPRATRVLVNEGVWQSWRGDTRVRIEPRLLARAWLGASHGARRDAPMIEEWQSVLEDLKERLEDADLDVLIRRDASSQPRARWPWIAPYEREQVQGLARLAASLEQVVEIARAVDPVRDLRLPTDRAGGFREVLDMALTASDFHERLHVDVVHWLARPEMDIVGTWPLGPGELRALLAVAGSLRARAVNLYTPMPDIAVQEAAAWLTEQNSLRGADRVLLRRLDTWIQARGDLPELPDTKPRPDLANQLRAEFPGLARIADPPRGKGLYNAVVPALERGDDRSPYFTELSVEIEKWAREPPASCGPHPLQRLTEAVREVQFGPALHLQGEATFLKACSWHPRLVEPVSAEGASLPALDFLLALVPAEEELPAPGGEDARPGCAGAVACRLVAALIVDRQLHPVLERDGFWPALLTSLTAPSRRTGGVRHRPVAAVVELLRLGLALSPWRPRFDAALQIWLDGHGAGRPRFPVPSFPRVPPKGARP